MSSDTSTKRVGSTSPTSHGHLQLWVLVLALLLVQVGLSIICVELQVGCQSNGAQSKFKTKLSVQLVFSWYCKVLWGAVGSDLVLYKNKSWLSWLNFSSKLWIAAYTSCCWSWDMKLIYGGKKVFGHLMHLWWTALHYSPSEFYFSAVTNIQPCCMCTVPSSSKLNVSARQNPLQQIQGTRIQELQEFSFLILFDEQ